MGRLAKKFNDYMIERFEKAVSVLKLHKKFREDGQQAYFLRGANGRFLACVIEADVIKYKPSLIKDKK